MHDGDAALGRGLTSLVFPAYNPGPGVERTWQEVRRFLRDRPEPWEVLFVCDGCTDGTPARLESLVRDEPQRARVLSYAPNRGKGYAVRRGLEVVRGAWRVFTDVDLSYGLDGVLRVAEALRGGAEVVIAARTHPDSRLVYPFWAQSYAYRRHLQSRVFSALVRGLLPLPHRDTQAGLKGFSAAAAGLLLPRLRCDGFAFDCELLTACVRHGVAVAEVPVCYHCDGGASTTNVAAMARMVQDLFRIRRDWRHTPLPVAIPAEPARRAAA